MLQLVLLTTTNVFLNLSEIDISLNPLLNQKSSFLDKNILKLKKFNIFWSAQFGYLYFLSFQLLNEPGFGAEIDCVMALTPFSSSIG
jgi:hypothetical protein